MLAKHSEKVTKSRPLDAISRQSPHGRPGIATPIMIIVRRSLIRIESCRHMMIVSNTHVNALQTRIKHLPISPHVVDGAEPIMTAMMMLIT